MLDPDVALRADTVALGMATARQAQGAPPLSGEIRGREAVAGVFAGQAAAAQAALIDGDPGAVWAPAGRARVAFVMRWSEGRIVEIEIVADPRRLRGPPDRLLTPEGRGADHETFSRRALPAAVEPPRQLQGSLTTLTGSGA